MTALSPENKQPETLSQAETSLSSQTVDTNLTQNKVDTQQQNKEEKTTTETQEDPNWRAFREARKREREEKEAAERRAAEKEAEVAALKAAMEAAFSKSAPSPQAYQQYYGIQDQQESEEDRIEKRVNEILEKKEQQKRQEFAEREMREYPQRLARDFPDIANVCSQENLDYLDYHYPELSRPLQRLPDGYDKWHDIYHAVKKFIPNHAAAKKDAIKADINSQKPKSMSTTSITQPGEAPGNTLQQIEQRRAENWARMQRVMKGI